MNDRLIPGLDPRRAPAARRKMSKKADWTPLNSRARKAMLNSGLTYSRIVSALKARNIKASISGVRNVVCGYTKRHDIREIVAELTDQPVERLWPDAAFQEVA